MSVGATSVTDDSQINILDLLTFIALWFEATGGGTFDP